MSEYKVLPPKEAQEYIDAIHKVADINNQDHKLTGKTKNAYILTFGCQQNEADSEKLAGMCRDMGYGIIGKPDNADLILVNTCAIREHAEKRALSFIGQFKHIKQKNPKLLIGVCGCMVVQEHRREEIKHSYPYVDFIFGASSIHRLPSLIFQKMSREKRIYCPDESEYLVAEGLRIDRSSTYRAWVSIMYGCNNFCTYCIVPYVRGRERSRDPKEIISEVRGLVENGYRDITLLGQNVNSYGKDAQGGMDFADLLCELDKIEGDYVLRFMTSHPKDASRKLIDVMASSKHIAHQFHLPMQSGSNEVLLRMNRRYDREKYSSILGYMREKMPDIVVSSDIIVGFPGESEQDFEDTLSALREFEFDMIFSFIYSPRKGTPAAEMECQIPDETKSVRFDRLLSVQNEISFRKNSALIGSVHRVLCDGESKKGNGVYSGRDEGNKIVLFDGEPCDIGNFLNIKITNTDTFSLYGEKERD